MKHNSIFLILLIVFTSCKNNSDESLVKDDDSKIDGRIVLSADGMSGFPDEHFIKVSSYYQDGEQKKAGMKSMRIGSLNIPKEENGEANYLQIGKTVNNQLFKSGRILFGKGIDINGLLPTEGNTSSARIQAQDFYSPELINLELIQKEERVKSELYRDSDLKVKWNVDDKNNGLVYVNLICKPNSTSNLNTELKTIKKEVKDKEGEIIIEKKLLNSLPLNNDVTIIIGRGDQKTVKVENKNVRITSYNTSSKTALIVK
jgi:hypothetical protein